VVNILHPGIQGLSRVALRDKIAASYKVKEPENVVIYGLKTDFGGGRTKGFFYEN
jgi:small subunit ribosomal protein S24e